MDNKSLKNNTNVKSKSILITGHEGLVGSHLKKRLESLNYKIIGIDLKSNNLQAKGDIRNYNLLKTKIYQADGIIHLAAVSRVITGEQNPDLCWETNAVASKNLLEIALNSPHKPWVIVASSREVYGEPKKLPVNETFPLNPVNIYGKSKVELEKNTLDAKNKGLNTVIIRLSNVYGSLNDHEDRVLPAFCKAAALGKNLYVEGKNHTFDFTHINDVVKAFVRLIQLMEDNCLNIPPFHFTTGVPLTLMEAAEIAVKSANSKSRIEFRKERSFDVKKFVGDPSLSKDILGFTPEILPWQGISMFVKKYQQYYNNEVQK